jgi:DNA-binding MarR family transcriptional regulator
MLSTLRPRGAHRWPRGQRFQLTETGQAAEAAHAEAVRDARAQGRSALDGAQRRWSEPLGLETGDGVVLGELKQGRRSLADVARALEDCGSTRGDVKEAVDRLVDRGLVQPLPLPAQAQV